MFGCGTGVVVVSIGQIQYNDQMYTIPHNPLVLLLRDTITGMQRGKINHEWSYKVPEWRGVQGEIVAEEKGNDENPEDIAA
jgi:branched-chain amino acid aminotransferase